MNVLAWSFSILSYSLTNIIIICSIYLGKPSFDKYQYIFNICLNTLNVKKYPVYLILKNIPRSAYAHREPIVSKFSKLSENGCHASNSGIIFYFIMYHVDIWFNIALESFQLIHLITYYSQRVWIINYLFIEPEIIWYEYQNTFFPKYS